MRDRKKKRREIKTENEEREEERRKKTGREKNERRRAEKNIQKKTEGKTQRQRETNTKKKKQKGREDDLNSRFKNACLMMEKNYAKNSRHHVIAIFVDPHVSTNQAPCEPSMQSNILTTMPVIIVDLVYFFFVFSQRKCQ